MEEEEEECTGVFGSIEEEEKEEMMMMIPRHFHLGEEEFPMYLITVRHPSDNTSDHYQ